MRMSLTCLIDYHDNLFINDFHLDGHNQLYTRVLVLLGV